MTDDLITFICARLDEDERVAREASGGGPEGSELFVIDDDYRHNTIAIPAERVLAEVEAKRRIIEWCVAAQDRMPGPGPLIGSNVLAALALPYAGHPDFREEWRP